MWGEGIAGGLLSMPLDSKASNLCTTEGGDDGAKWAEISQCSVDHELQFYLTTTASKKGQAKLKLHNHTMQSLNDLQFLIIGTEQEFSLFNPSSVPTGSCCTGTL